VEPRGFNHVIGRTPPGASIKENLMPKNAHTEAAEHHEKGDHATASKHAEEAHGHSTKAHESSSTARSKSKK
jgi:hypothetical protein